MFLHKEGSRSEDREELEEAQREAWKKEVGSKKQEAGSRKQQWVGGVSVVVTGRPFLNLNKKSHTVAGGQGSNMLLMLTNQIGPPKL